MRVIIIGAGGHAQVIADSLMRAHEQSAPEDPIAYLDDNPALVGQRFLGLPVLGSVAQLPEFAHDAIVIAIGDNATRMRLFRMLVERGERLVVARHPNAVIAPDVPIGCGTMICAGVVVNPGSAIGANAILNTGCTVDHHNRIGDHVHIAPGANLGGEVTIGDGSLIGIGAAVMPGRQVGAWCLIGAGALLRDNVPDGSTAFGVPARVMRRK